MDERNMMAYCGLYCGACEMFLATKNNKLEVLSIKKNIPEELLSCEGCKSDIHSVNCKNCVIKKCCKMQNIDDCGACTEFPCTVLKAFQNDGYPHHLDILKQLNKYHEQGKEAFLVDIINRWKCTRCGTSYSWYDEICEQCGAKVKSYASNLR